jgi:hypothetical protein
MVSHLLDLKWRECLCTNNRSRSSDARQKGKGGWMQVLYFEFAVLYFPFVEPPLLRPKTGRPNKREFRDAQNIGESPSRIESCKATSGCPRWMDRSLFSDVRTQGLTAPAGALSAYAGRRPHPLGSNRVLDALGKAGGTGRTAGGHGESCRSKNWAPRSLRAALRAISFYMIRDNPDTCAWKFLI